MVEDTFCLHVREVMSCPSCTRPSPSPPHDYDTRVFYVPVTSLMEAANLLPTPSNPNPPKGSMVHGALLQAAGKGDVYSCSYKDCPTARQGSKDPPLLTAARRYLPRPPPRVLSLQLVWDSLRDDGRKLETVLHLIDPVINLASLLPLPSPSHTFAELRGFFAFHPQRHHYVAFLYHERSPPRISQWVCVDDSMVQVLGPAHSDAIAYCAAQHYQPSLLFYQLFDHHASVEAKGAEATREKAGMGGKVAVGMNGAAAGPTGNGKPTKVTASR